MATIAKKELLEACKVALEALYNAPEVGNKYDQQHSDTHMRAILELKDAIAKHDNA